MKITFFGAARAVTGSCHCLEVGGKKLLIDCGLEQGKDERDNEQLPFVSNQIDAVVVTHAHIDHSGRLPLLVKQGFSGTIHATRKTCELLAIMLRDSAHIQEMDANWENQKGKRAGKEPIEPLYTIEDAERTLELLTAHEYGDEVEVVKGAKVKFVDAGHLLGSASLLFTLTEGNLQKTIVFSGDIGNINQPIIRDPEPIAKADYVVMESTYGNREHEHAENYRNKLAEIIDETFQKGGNVIVPAFAVGRTQELLYCLREIKEEGLVRSLPDFPIFVDSPLAGEATRIYDGDLHGYADEETIEVIQSGSRPLSVPNLNITQSTDESKALNADNTPKLIISASGMCDAGRIRHHLKHNLWRPECAIVFVGYQAEGTLGRLLIDGIEKVKLFGEEIRIAASIYNFRALSAHAGKSGLLQWAAAFENNPEQFFIVHGEDDARKELCEELRASGRFVHDPAFEEVYDLAENRLLAEGITIRTEPKKQETSSAAYGRLRSAAKELLSLIDQSKGRANKDIAKLTDQILALIQKWK